VVSGECTTVAGACWADWTAGRTQSPAQVPGQLAVVRARQIQTGINGGQTLDPLLIFGYDFSMNERGDVRNVQTRAYIL